VERNVSLLLGIDGGGTKTDFLLIDGSGRMLASRRDGSAYYPEIGLDALRAMLVEGMRATLAAGSVSAKDLSFACIGLPTYGEDSALVPHLDQIVSSILPISRYRCVNDMVCGWAGALAGRDGINVVAGTGSIGYGEYETRCARAGGWGEVFSDEGSAYWIAREGLSLFSKMSDGRAPRGASYQLLREHFDLSVDLDVCAAVYGPPPLSRSEIAALAPLIARAAHAGDQGARRIFETAAQELSAIINAIRDQLAVPPQTLLGASYSGGMFARDDLLIGMLRAALEMSGRRYEFSAPRLAPVAGAVVYAGKLCNSPVDAQALSQLAQTHGAAMGGTGDAATP
jgi:N-acetylglucosamine kinase-like BadF-type ATPase